MLIPVIAMTAFACNSEPKNSQGTGQEDGINTIDSTPAQTSDTVAPGTNAGRSDTAENGDSPNSSTD